MWSRQTSMRAHAFDFRSISHRESQPLHAREANVAVRLYVDLVKQACAAWLKDRAPTMGAALAFYCAFALAPLLVIVIALGGAVWGADAARGAIVGQLAGMVGVPAAEAIQALLRAAPQTTTGVFAAIVGIVTTLVAATTLVVELQDDLDYIWKAPTRPGRRWPWYLGWPRPPRPGWRGSSPTGSGMRWRPGLPTWRPQR